MAGTVTLTKSGLGSISQWRLGWTSDGSGDATLSFPANGALRRAIFNPGSPAPTALYDVVLNDQDGFDVLGAEGANLSATVTSEAATGSLIPYVAGQLDLAVSNAGSAKAGEVVIYLET